MSGWHDEPRRTQARAAIASARARLRCTVTWNPETSVWFGRCEACREPAEFPTLASFEEWATRQHRCAS